MLRASAEFHQTPVDVRAVGSAAIDSGLAAGSELLAFTDAVVLRDDHEVADARRRLTDRLASPAAMRTAAVAGNFEMMNRLLDAAGVPVTDGARKAAIELGLPVR